MQCVILAGGLGSRMYPLTRRLPKSLILIDEDPFAHHQLSWLASHGVSAVIYAIGIHGEQLRDYVGDGSRWGLAVRYVDEGEALRGTAGALRLAFDAGVLDEDFLVTYGDSYLRLDHRDLFAAHRLRGCPATMAVFRNRGRWDRSNVRFQGGMVELYDKHATDGERATMDFIDYGVAVLARSVVAERIPRDEPYDLATVYHQLSGEGQLAGYEAHKRFFEIGSPTGLEDFRRFMRREGAPSC